MKLLMCPPLYYRHRSEERERALSEWRGLYRLLRDELRVEVDLLEPRPELPGLAHVGSGGFVAGDTFIASCNPGSRRETGSEPLENFFLVRGYDIKHLDSEFRFEGTRDLTTCNGTLFTGFHPEDLHYRAQEEIGAILGSEVVRLELAAHWQRPLADCLCPVGDEEAIFCPTAFTSRAREQLKARISKLVPVDESEDTPTLCDSLIVGKDLIVAEGCTAVPFTLESLGFNVHELPLNEFSEDGGPRTLALQLE